ncbi:MAG: FecR family protein, partial [Chloroflexota bacterium]|nr:FecR family protein [Chloroflexota bacterium]
MRRTTKGTRRGPPLLLLGLLLLVLASGPLAVWPVRPAVAQGPAIEERIVVAEIVVGRHYRQAGGVSGLGYDVLEPFFAPYLGFGGPAAVGYPVSVPFRSRDGCVYQAFQILLLQACAALPVRLANTFEILEEAGADPLLMGLGVGSAERDTGATAEEAAGIRMGWLTDSAIKSRYLADCGRGDAAAAIERCGLPMNRPQRFGPFVSQRFQRIAYQRWLDDGPAGIKTGDVTPVLGGDLLKTSATLPGATGSPHARASLQGIDEAQFTSIAYTPATERNGPAVDFRDRATLGILQAQVNTTDQTTPSLFQPGRQGQELIVGDRVRTDANGSALVTYFEGTTAEIGPSSEVVVQRVVTGESGLALPNLTLSQVAGQVIYRLTRALLAGARLDIQTPSATATVRGTVLRVSVLPDGGTRVEVFSGQVDVAAAGIVVSVWPGTFTEVTPGQPPAPPALNPPAAPFILTNPD